MESVQSLPFVDYAAPASAHSVEEYADCDDCRAPKSARAVNDRALPKSARVIDDRAPETSAHVANDRALETSARVAEGRAPEKSARVVNDRAPEKTARLVAWFGAWRKPLCAWLRRRASVPPADIDDLAQEVFLRLLRYSDETNVENPQAYLFRIAANVANEWRERARVRHPHDNAWLEDLQIDANEQPENATRSDDRARIVKAAVDLLPPRQREVLLLHVNDGLTYKQIAQQRGLTYRIVLRDLTRAYSSLRNQLKLEDVL